MFCSVIIPTIGRATLVRAVDSVLDQNFSPADVEVIIVNDSGEDLTSEAGKRSERVRLITTQRRERSFARNAGAAVARGEYLCFLDDDDWLLPGALEAWRVAARQAPQAAWVFGGIRVVDENGATLGEVNSGLSGNCFAQIMGGAWAPIQASLIRADAFFRVGGYDPTICGTEDLDLCRRIALGSDFANTPATVACLFRGRSWTTSTDYDRAPADTRRSRDAVLAEPGAWTRLREAARASSQPAYWYGRGLKVYASTVGLNARQGRVLAASGRSLAALAWCGAAGGYMLSRNFWGAARAAHVPGSLHYIMEAYETSGKARDGAATAARGSGQPT